MEEQTSTSRALQGRAGRRDTSISCHSAADRDIITRALKEYGDALEGSCQADTPEEAARRKVLRSVMLLICLTKDLIVRFLPQVMDSIASGFVSRSCHLMCEY